jgi:hypothetical protein
MAQPFIIVPPVIIDDVKLLLSDVPENDYAEWNAAVNYVKGDRVILVSTHTIYEAASANLNKNPATNKAIWLVVSATNRWKVFDDKTLSQTEQIESMSYTLLPGKAVNTVGLINCHAKSARIRVTDPIDGLVYDKTKNFLGKLSKGDWYEYFFEEIIRETDKVFTDLPAYGSAQIKIDIENALNMVRCGVITMGFKRTIGIGVSHGVDIGVQDYSRREINEFGEPEFVKRGYSKTASFNITIRDFEVDVAQRLLASIRATPTLFIGSTLYNSTIIYGWYRDFSETISYKYISEMAIEVESLV